MRLLLFNLATDIDDPVLGFTIGWIRALASRVEFIHVITMRVGRIDLPDNVRVYSVGKEKGYSEPRRGMEFYRRLFRVVRAGQVDICFSHMIPIFTILAAPVLKVRRVPIVTWFAHPSLTRTLKLAHHLSDRMVTSLPTAYPYKHNKVTAIGQGIDTDHFSPDSQVVSDEPPMILCVGRLSAVKDHETLLKAAALLRDTWGKPFRVIIVGDASSRMDGWYVKIIHQLARTLGLQDVVHFQQAVRMEELPKLYQRCTVHVNMTPTGSGDKVALEAMSCGRPCLVANEGFRKTIGEYAGLSLFQHADAKDLAQRLERVLLLPDHERTLMAAALRRQVSQNHSLQHLSSELVRVFREVIRDKGGCDPDTR